MGGVILFITYETEKHRADAGAVIAENAGKILDKDFEL